MASISPLQPYPNHGSFHNFAKFFPYRPLEPELKYEHLQAFAESTSEKTQRKVRHLIIGSHFKELTTN